MKLTHQVDILAVGTSEGAKKGWDERGRGQAEGLLKKTGFSQVPIDKRWMPGSDAKQFERKGNGDRVHGFEVTSGGWTHYSRDKDGDEGEHSAGKDLDSLASHLRKWNWGGNK